MDAKGSLEALHKLPGSVVQALGSLSEAFRSSSSVSLRPTHVDVSEQGDQVAGGHNFLDQQQKFKRNQASPSERSQVDEPSR